MNSQLLKDAGENYEYIRTIIENRIELTKISATEKTSKIFGSVILYTIMGIFGFLIFVLGLFCLGLWFSSMMESTIAGFGIVALILIAMLLCTYIFRKKLILEPISNFIFNNIFD